MHQRGILGWLLQVFIIFLVIKFILYPGLGLILDTSQPVVAVISGSMEHPGSFEQWWEGQQQFYDTYDITETQFRRFPLMNGFEQGDLIVLRGAKDLKIGDIIVFEATGNVLIIHRIIAVHEQGETRSYTTKGDNNAGVLPQETSISEERIIGKSLISIPYLGNIRILGSQVI